jgi:hypothetical protein
MSTVNRHIYGVDFSGAKDAGKHIWVAGGVIAGEALRIDTCRRADTLPGSSKQREQCLSTLRTFIADKSNAAFGCDFPFGLPATLVDQGSWESFVLAFPGLYESADAFKQACHEASGGSEFKRVTDQESQTPFSPYNLWIYRQTYYGIRDVLHPLVRDGTACVLPMQTPQPGRPWLLEVCPASTLKQEWPHRRYSYKGREEQKREAREHILESFEDKEMLIIPDREIRAKLLENQGGDALDSVIAALAAARALRSPDGLIPPADKVYAIEGYVYV